MYISLIKNKLKLYNVLVLSTLFYGSECWNIKAKTNSRIVAAKIKFVRKSFCYNWIRYKTNTEILNEFKIASKITSIKEKINI